MSIAKKMFYQMFTQKKTCLSLLPRASQPSTSPEFLIGRPTWRCSAGRCGSVPPETSTARWDLPGSEGRSSKTKGESCDHLGYMYTFKAKCIYHVHMYVFIYIYKYGMYINAFYMSIYLWGCIEKLHAYLLCIGLLVLPLEVKPPKKWNVQPDANLLS